MPDATNVIVGAGPAGLTAAWRLARLGQDVAVLEADPVHVGGLSRTVEYRGHRFDLGGHRFYTRSAEVGWLWEEMLPGGFVDVPRLSRIYYERRFFPYPIELGATLATLGPRRAARVVASSAAARVRPRRPEVSFEDWIVNRFGGELYEAFFRTYTEKVWGMDCRRISKDFAAQRIRGLSLGALVAGRLPWAKAERGPKTLIERFRYPRRGPGELWEAVRDEVVARGGRVELDRRAVRFARDGRRLRAVETEDGELHAGERFFPTLPLRDLVGRLDPPPPAAVREAARALRFRDFLTVALVVDEPAVFPDTWIYVHDRRRRRAHPELRQLERRHGRAVGHDLPRARILLLSRRPALGARGRRPRRARRAGARADRARGRGPLRGRACRPRAGRVSRLRRRVPRAARAHPPLAPDRRAERAPRRPRRAAQLQQPGPRDGHRPPRGPQRARGGAARPVGGEHRGGVRGGRARRVPRAAARSGLASGRLRGRGSTRGTFTRRRGHPSVGARSAGGSQPLRRPLGHPRTPAGPKKRSPEVSAEASGVHDPIDGRAADRAAPCRRGGSDRPAEQRKNEVIGSPPRAAAACPARVGSATPAARSRRQPVRPPATATGSRPGGRRTQSRITLYTGNTYFRYPQLRWPGTFRAFQDYDSHLDLIALYTLDESTLNRMRELELLVHEPWRIASRQRSSTTREYIGAVQSIAALRAGKGEFAGEEDFYTYWRRYHFRIGRAVQNQLDRLLAEQRDRARK